MLRSGLGKANFNSLGDVGQVWLDILEKEFLPLDDDWAVIRGFGVAPEYTNSGSRVAI